MTIANFFSGLPEDRPQDIRHIEDRRLAGIAERHDGDKPIFFALEHVEHLDMEGREGMAEMMPEIEQAEPERMLEGEPLAQPPVPPDGVKIFGRDLHRSASLFSRAARTRARALRA